MPSRRPRLTSVALALVLLAVAVPAARAAGSLLGQWHLDFGTSSANNKDLTFDSSGNGHDLTADCSGCTMLLPPGKFGTGALDQTSNSPLATATGIRPATVTVVAWVRHLGTPVGNQVIAAQAADQFTCDRMAYRLRYADGDNFSGLEFSVLAGGQVVSSPRFGTNGVWDGNWHMLAGAYDGKFVHLYIDGSEIRSPGTATPGATAIDRQTTAGSFGIDGFTGNLNCAPRNFVGSIDEVRVYDHSLGAFAIAKFASATGPTPPELDTDGDGVPDSTDNCLSTPNANQSDPNQNGVGAACEPPVAHLSIAPNPTCVDANTTFHGETSTGESPIVNYKFTYPDADPVAFDNAVQNGQPFPIGTTISGSAPKVTRVLDYNRGQQAYSYFNGYNYPYTKYFRDDIDVTLAVTSANGQTTTTTEHLKFAQHAESESASHCPAVAQQLAGQNTLPPLPAPVTLSGLVQYYTGCPSDLSCAGSILLLSTRQRGFASGVRGSAAKSSRPALIGAQRYVIRPHKKAKIKIKLSRSARRFLAKHRKLRVKVVELRVGVRGKLLSHTKVVTLKLPKPHKKK